MAEYIEREAAIAKRRKVSEYDEAGFFETYHAVPVTDINEIPAADVAPVVHSRWVYDERLLAVCLECGMTAVEDGTDYCPNCGAKMDGDA